MSAALLDSAPSDAPTLTDAERAEVQDLARKDDEIRGPRAQTRAPARVPGEHLAESLRQAIEEALGGLPKYATKEGKRKLSGVISTTITRMCTYFKDACDRYAKAQRVKAKVDAGMSVEEATHALAEGGGREAPEARLCKGPASRRGVPTAARCLGATPMTASSSIASFIASSSSSSSSPSASAASAST